MDSARLYGQFFTTQQLSENRSLTPEGFLLIRNVPIARTGTQIYAAHELPRLQSKDGLIIVERPEEEVFRPDTIASYNGKPLTDDHPFVGMLTPDNWRDFARGSILNPRRGDGLSFDSNFMYGDVLVTDRDAINAIEAGKKEVSAGYDASYENIEPGRARCLDIIGNHVALVDKGRCGPHCAVGDSAHQGDSKMAVKSSTRSKFLDRFRSAVSRGNTRDALEAVGEAAKDPELLGEIISDEMAGVDPDPEPKNPHHIEVHTHLNGMPANVTGAAPAAKDDLPVDPAAAGGDVGSQIAALSQRLDNIEQILTQLANEESEESGSAEIGDKSVVKDEIITATETPNVAKTPDLPTDKPGQAPDLPTEHPGIKDRAMVGDSAKMREAFVAALSKAETLCPGIQLPTFDAALPAKETFDALCAFRRKTLDAAYKLDELRIAIDAVIDGRKAQFHDREWTCDAIAVAFNGASSLIAQKNQRAVHPRVGGSGGNNGFGSRPPTPAEMNAKARSVFKLDAQ